MRLTPMRDFLGKITKRDILGKQEVEGTFPFSSMREP